MPRVKSPARPLIALPIIFGLSISLGACRLDPTPQEVIDSLGPESGSPGDTHRPGQPCVVCHGSYGAVSPQMVFGGTAFTNDEDGNVIPAQGVEVIVFDSAGGSRKRCTNAAGNFYLEKEEWKDVAFPLTVKAGSRRMRSLIGRDGSCGSCHKIPDVDFPERDPETGAAYDSAGYVLVDPADQGACQ
ncbi:MAG: hypothetical protein IPK82_14485 [Polyangiaceae bacterium]|nr:hypothetical protein [Polyangiaceae bacterium]